MVRKLIIDADPGIGDALALLVALFDPDVDVLSITPTAGQVDGATAGRNIQSIVEQLDAPKFPRLGDMSEPASELETIDIGERTLFRAKDPVPGFQPLGCRLARWNRRPARSMGTASIEPTARK